MRNIPNHAPISSTRSDNGRRACVTILNASNRISATLFRRANNGANGNAATNKVTNPYCKTDADRNQIKSLNNALIYILV